MSADGASKDDVKVPEGEVGEQIEKDFEGGKDLMVTILTAMGGSLNCTRLGFRTNQSTRAGDEAAIAVKEAPTGGA